MVDPMEGGFKKPVTSRVQFREVSLRYGNVEVEEEKLCQNSAKASDSHRSRAKRTRKRQVLHGKMEN